MNLYQQQILDHYHNPQNNSRPKQFDHSHKLANLSCGDEIEVYINVEDEKIKNISYEATGCAISIATASMLSEQLQGMPTAEILSLKEEFLTEMLGIELTATRMKCALLSLSAIKSAIRQQE